MEDIMIRVKPIQNILRYVLASGRLKDEKPLSAIIIAPIESGKTSIINKYCLRAKNIFYTTDATAYGIIRDTNQLQDFRSRRLSHIVIPDLLACLGRKQTTVKTFIYFMNALIEEGVVNLNTFATQLQGHVQVKAGFITAITPDSFEDRRHQWAKIGFLSRALPVSFDYKPSTRVKILSYIQKQKHLEEELKKLRLPKKSQVIGLPLKMAREIEPYALSLRDEHSQYQKVYGFRYQKQLQTLAKAIALANEKEEVDKDCMDELGELANFINFEFNRI
jgi:hypothetical protein